MNEEQKELELKYFVFKANVPLKDTSEMLDWTKSCQGKTPLGHNDYRWGKILHDHLFVKNFKNELELLQQNQDTIFELLRKIIKTLDTKEIKDANSELFK